MYIVHGSGSNLRATILVGSVRNAQGHVVKALANERATAANLLRRFLFPNDAAFHQAKRRGERALSA